MSKENDPDPALPTTEKKEKKAADADTLTISNDDLQARIDKELEKERKKVAAEREKEKTDADAAKKKQAGEFEALYQKECSDRKADQAALELARKENRSKDVDVKLRDAIAASNTDYLASARYIKPLIEFATDTPDEELDKRIKAAIETFVKDNPRAAKSGAPSHPVRGKSDETQGDKAKPSIKDLPRPSYMR